MVYRLGTDEA